MMARWSASRRPTPTTSSPSAPSARGSTPAPRPCNSTARRGAPSPTARPAPTPSTRSPPPTSGRWAGRGEYRGGGLELQRHGLDRSRYLGRPVDGRLGLLGQRRLCRRRGGPGRAVERHELQRRLGHGHGRVHRGGDAQQRDRHRGRRQRHRDERDHRGARGQCCQAGQQCFGPPRPQPPRRPSRPAAFRGRNAVTVPPAVATTNAGYPRNPSSTLGTKKHGLTS